MALAANEQQKANELAWDRRQAASVNQKKGGRGLDFSSGAVAGESKRGGGILSARNMVALAQSQDRVKFLKDQLVNEAKVQALGAAGALAGSVVPGLGTAAGRQAAVIVARSPAGKWIWWGVCLAAGLSILATIMICVATLQYICTSHSSLAAASKGAAAGGAAGAVAGPTGGILGSIGGAVGGYIIRDQYIGGYCEAFD